MRPQEAITVAQRGAQITHVPEWVGKAFKPRARASYRSILLALARTKPARYRSGAGVSGHFRDAGFE